MQRGKSFENKSADLDNTGDTLQESPVRANPEGAQSQKDRRVDKEERHEGKEVLELGGDPFSFNKNREGAK